MDSKTVVLEAHLKSESESVGLEASPRWQVDTPGGRFHAGWDTQAPVTRTSRQLHHMKLITERWSVQQKWSLLLTRLLRRLQGGKWLCGIPPEAATLLSGCIDKVIPPEKRKALGSL